MDSKLWMIILGAALVVGGGVIGLSEKLNKKAQNLGEEESVRNEKKHGWLTFFIAAIGAALSFVSGYSGWSENRTDKAIADSTHKANDSLTHKLLKAQDDLNNLAGMQLDSTNKSLELSQKVISAQNKLNDAQNNLSIAQNRVTALQQESLKQFTGGNNKPFLYAYTFKPSSYHEDTSLLMIGFDIINNSAYPLHSVSGTFGDDENVELASHGYKWFRGLHSSTIYNTGIKQALGPSSIYNPFNPGTISSNQSINIHTGVIDFKSTKDTLFYYIGLRWYGGSIEYYLFFSKRSQKLKELNFLVIINNKPTMEMTEIRKYFKIDQNVNLKSAHY